ncbi:PREDICTED: cytochrome P450 71A4-like [Fragaria vesca subsp. vesca]
MVLNLTCYKNSPPSPPKLLVLRQLLKIGSNPHRSLQKLAQRYGPDLMLLYLGTAPLVIVSSAEAASEIMKTNDLDPSESGGDGSGEGGKDFVDVLLEVRSSGNEGSSIDRDSIKGIILPSKDMFSGGTDTTYTVLEWAMTEILRHPRVCGKLQIEALEIANGKPDITESDLDNMRYLKAVIKETLRLHPPIPLLAPRESTEVVKIMEHDIEAKTMVFINAWAIGRDPAEWDEPEEFRPERFKNSSVDFKGQDFQLLPFVAGRRGCPGISFSMTTNELVLANILHKFDWELPAGTSAEAINMTECSGVVAHRKIPLVAVAKPSFF